MSSEIIMQKQYIFIRSLHWLSIGMQIRQHYLALSQDAVLIVGNDMEKSLEVIGLHKGKDFLTLQTFGATMVSNPPHSLSLCLHHHKKSIDEFWRITRLTLKNTAINISFFADGYTNLLINREDLAEFIEKNPQITPQNLLFFDNIPVHSARHSDLFTALTVQSSGIKAISGLPYFKEKSKIVALRCVEDAKGHPILLIMLRPWGSDTFHGGLLSFSDAAERLKDLILILISNIKMHVGCDLHIVLRPDGRDPNLMHHFMVIFKKYFEGTVTDLTELWPDDLTMDPLLYNFDEFGDKTPLYVAGLDSTASLPFLRLGKGQRHYFGVPLADAEKMFSAKPDTWAMMQAKLARLERHARALAAQQPIEITKLDPLLFCATLPASNG